MHTCPFYSFAGTSHALLVVPVLKQKSQSIKIRAQKKYSRVYLMYKKTAIG